MYCPQIGLYFPLETAILRIFDTDASDDGGFGEDKNGFSSDRRLKFELESFAGTPSSADIVISASRSGGKVETLSMNADESGHFTFTQASTFFALTFCIRLYPRG